MTTQPSFDLDALAAAVTADDRSQNAIGAAAGLPRGALSRILNRKILRPDLEHLRGLAETLGVPLPQLLGEPAPAAGVGRRPEAGAEDTSSPLRMIPLDRIAPSRFNPRTTIDTETQDFADFASSIAGTDGPIQPLLVAPATPELLPDHIPAADFVIVAGERRWTAAWSRARAGEIALDTALPCLVMEAVTPAELIELALTENVQRENLSPLEEAAAFRRLIDEFGHTTVTIAAATSKTQRWVQQRLALLELGHAGRAALRQGMIGPAAARHIARLEDKELEQAVIDQIRAGALPAAEDAVRERVNRLLSKPASERRSPPGAEATPERRDGPGSEDAGSPAADGGATQPAEPASHSPPAERLPAPKKIGDGYRHEDDPDTAGVHPWDAQPHLKGMAKPAPLFPVASVSRGIDGHWPTQLELWDKRTATRQTYVRHDKAAEFEALWPVKGDKSDA